MQVSLTRNRISSWLLLFMIIILSAGLFVVEFMQIPLEQENEINQYRVLIKHEVLKDVVHMSLKNKVGTFTLAKSPETNEWMVTSPRHLPASGQAVSAIFSLMENIRVLKLHENEPINRSNFSLESPYLSIGMETHDKSKYTIDFGLINPIDSTSYIYSSNTDHIYHIDEIDSALATLDLNELVDGRIFIFTPNRVSQISVHRIASNQERLQSSLVRLDKTWNDQYNKSVANEKVMEYLTEFSNIKSALILDMLHESASNDILPMKNNLQFKVVIKDIDENVKTFLVSAPASKNLPDYKIEKGKTIFVHTENEKAIYILNKDISRLLNTSISGQSELSIKKLFY